MKAAVLEARADLEWDSKRNTIRRLLAEARLAERIPETEKAKAALKRIGASILEICGETQKPE